MARRALANVRSIFGVDLRLADAGQLVLDRVFHRHDVAGGWCPARPSAAYSVVVLPEPVGPVTSTMPCGWCDQARRSAAARRRACPAPSRSSWLWLLSSRRSTARSPWALGRVRHAHVDGAAADAQARCGRPAAGASRQMSSSAMIFRRDDQRRVQRAVGLHHFAQRAVHAEAHGWSCARRARCGCRWRRRVAACVSSALSMRMMGASSAASSRSSTGGQVLHHAAQVGIALHLAHHRRPHCDSPWA